MNRLVVDFPITILLAGSYPFESEYTSNVIKIHIFQEPPPLCQINLDIPVPLSNILSKLMEKNVDSRYQSAKGIMHDIDLINSESELGREMILAERDISDTFIPQKLYGRKKKFDELVKAHDRIASSSSFELVFVQGHSGTGKTTLVRELNEHAMQYGIFIHGKYNCFD